MGPILRRHSRGKPPGGWPRTAFSAPTGFAEYLRVHLWSTMSIVDRCAPSTVGARWSFARRGWPLRPFTYHVSGVG